jgi:hypothetical protein
MAAPNLNQERLASEGRGGRWLFVDFMGSLLLGYLGSCVRLFLCHAISCRFGVM